MTARLSYDRAVKRGTENDDNPEILLATHGAFSEPFFRRTHAALSFAPGLVAHIVRMKTASSRPESRVQSSKEPPVPFNPQAWDDANHIYSLLVYWCTFFAGRMKVQAPGPARRSWAREDGKIIGLPANITSDEARTATGTMGQWLRIQLESIMHLDPEEVTFFHDEIGDVFRMLARWPQKDRAAWSKLPCPRCGARIAVYVPTGIATYDPKVKKLVPHGGERRYVCESCDFAMTDEEFRDEFERVAVATREAQALVLKYGAQIPGEWRA